MNGKQRGVLRFFIYFAPKENEFVGVCVDLGIIKTGENAYYLKKDLEEAAYGYVEAVCNRNLPNDLLNQEKDLPREYAEIYKAILEMSKKGKSSKKVEMIKEPQTFFKNVSDLCPAF